MTAVVVATVASTAATAAGMVLVARALLPRRRRPAVVPVEARRARRPRTEER